MKCSIANVSLLVFLIIMLSVNYGDCFHRRKERLAEREKARQERLALQAAKKQKDLEKLKRTETSLEKKSVLEDKSLEKELKNTELSLSMQGDQGVPGLPGIRGPSGTDGRPVRNNYNTVYFWTLLSIVLIHLSCYIFCTPVYLILQITIL